MEGGIVRYAGENDTRSPSVRLWDSKGLALGHLKGNPEKQHFFDDFIPFVDGNTADKYTLTQAGTAGTVTLSDAAGGVISISAGDETDGDGVNLQLASETLLIPANGKFSFEGRFRLTTAIATIPPDFFFGLATTDTTILASSANTVANHIGFESVSEDGVVAAVSEAGGTRESVAGVHTFVVNEWVKLGMHYDGNLGRVETYVNGVLNATYITDTSDIPTDVEMTPSIVLQASATSAAGGSTSIPVAECDWIAFGANLRA